MVACLHAIARQAQHIADAHRGGTEDVALDTDAVPVTTRDLHDRRVARAGQERTHAHARHVTVGAAAVGRVDRIHIAVEDACAGVDLVRISGIGRCELGRHREAARAQHALETPW